MPKHVQAECFNNPEHPCDGCYGCHLAVCKICWGLEGGLTTDCPGEEVSFDKSNKVYTTDLDYTDEKGWHNTGVTMEHRTPNFEREV